MLRNWHNLRGRHLKAIILRHLGRNDEAIALIDESLRIDRFNFGCGFEKYLITGNDSDLKALVALMRPEGHNYSELALDYASAGCWEEALKVAGTAIGLQVADQTMLHYYTSWFLIRLDRKEEALAAIHEAEQQIPDCCFPNTL